jgi:hypothetical protein
MVKTNNEYGMFLFIDLHASREWFFDATIKNGKEIIMNYFIWRIIIIFI